MFTLLLLLFIKHWIADFVIQSEWQVSQKGTYLAAGGLLHAGIHGVLTALVLMFFIPILYTAVIMGLLDMLIHYHTDYVKARFGTKDPNTQMFWIQLGLDQLCHSAFYIWLVWILQELFN